MPDGEGLAPAVLHQQCLWVCNAAFSPRNSGAAMGPGLCDTAPVRALPLQFPSMKKTLEFKAHDGEIEDIALSPDNKVGIRRLPGPVGRAFLIQLHFLRAGGDSRKGLPVLCVAAGPAGDGAVLEREPSWHP